METLNTVLPVLVYLLLSALLVVLIILGIKLIKTVDRTNEILDNVEGKINSFNGLFDVVDRFTDSLGVVSGKMIEGITGLISRIFKRKEKIKEEKDDDIYE